MTGPPYRYGTSSDLDDGDRQNEAAEAWEKVRRLEAELQAAHNLAAKVGSLEAELAERYAALATAHEALRVAEWSGHAEPPWEKGKAAIRECPVCFAYDADGRHRDDCVIGRALSSPAPARSAEELRLLRELEAADEAQEAAEDAYVEACRPMMDSAAEDLAHDDAAVALDAARGRRDAALANLRRFREEKPR